MFEVRLLGPMEVRRDGLRVELPRSKKTRALLAYLAATGRPHTRTHLCNLLWETTDDPRGALRWSLSKLRPLVNDEVERLEVGLSDLEVAGLVRQEDDPSPSALVTEEGAAFFKRYYWSCH